MPDRRNLLVVEENLLYFSGVKNLKAYDVTIWGDCAIRTLEMGDPTKQKVVFLHQYGASGALYFEIMKPLSEHFQLIFFDQVGMGASQRYPFTAKSAEEGEKYFVDFIESWRSEMKLEKFILIGHSFGGFLSGLYAS